MVVGDNFQQCRNTTIPNILPQQGVQAIVVCRGWHCGQSAPMPMPLAKFPSPHGQQQWARPVMPRAHYLLVGTEVVLGIGGNAGGYWRIIGEQRENLLFLCCILGDWTQFGEQGSELMVKRMEKLKSQNKASSKTSIEMDKGNAFKLALFKSKFSQCFWLALNRKMQHAIWCCCIHSRPWGCAYIHLLTPNCLSQP